ncbi:MAG: alpha/beta hydrolase, partial [Spirochaetales bacterium]|nr:alpha/beta hydrolase [Spirochaetales bacterium]
WPEDVKAFIDILGIDRCAVLGISAGGPYALACAYKIPQRITKAGVIAGVGPIDIPGAREELPRIRRIGVFVATYFPWLLRPLLWLVSNPQHNPEFFFNKMLSGNSQDDIRFLMQPEIKKQLIKHYCEATHRGIRGFAREAFILSHPWGFKLEEIDIPVYLWHGEDDKNVSISAVYYMKEKLRNCHATLYPHQGHWFFHPYWAEILNTLR